MNQEDTAVGQKTAAYQGADASVVVIPAAGRGLFPFGQDFPGKLDQNASANTFFAVAGKHIIPHVQILLIKSAGVEAAIAQYFSMLHHLVKACVLRSTCFLFEHASLPSRLQGKSFPVRTQPPCGEARKSCYRPAGPGNRPEHAWFPGKGRERTRRCWEPWPKKPGMRPIPPESLPEL